MFGNPQIPYKLLVQHEGKVQAGNYMTLTVSNEATDECAGTFYVIAPNHAHAITKAKELACGDCHDNAAVQSYNETGKIDVVTWDGQGLVSPTGVIPVPPDWQEALQFAFACLQGTEWVFYKDAADVKQMLPELELGAPLSESQMQALSQAQSDD
jgi:hypothetical protein